MSDDRGDEVTGTPEALAVTSRMDRARAQPERIRSQVTELRASSAAVDTLFRLDERRRLVGGIVLAGALAFRMFVFLVPFMFVFVVSLGLYSSATSPEDASQLVGLKGVAATMVEDVGDETSGLRVTALVAGAVSMLWAAYVLVTVVRTVHGLVWRVPLASPQRRWVGPLVVVVFALAVAAGSRALSVAREELGGIGLTVTLSAVLALSAAWLATTLALPRASTTTWRDLVPGALVVGVGVQAIHLATVLYLAGQVASMSERYGAIGISLGLLTWAYLLGSLIVYGTILNAVLHERRVTSSEVDAMHDGGHEPDRYGQPERDEAVQQHHTDRIAG